MGTRLFVGGLSARCREEDLERHFEVFGRIRDIVMKDRFGFVEFDDLRDAEDAVREADGQSLMGERIGVEFARRPGEFGRREGRRPPVSFRTRPSPEFRPPPRPMRTPFRVIVENLAETVSWQDLKDYMRKAGDVCFTDAHRLRPGRGIVDFRTRDDMERALHQLDNVEIRGQRIRLLRDCEESRSSSSCRSRSPSKRSDTPSRSSSYSSRDGGSSSSGKSGASPRAPKKSHWNLPPSREASTRPNRSSPARRDSNSRRSPSPHQYRSPQRKSSLPLAFRSPARQPPRSYPGNDVAPSDSRGSRRSSPSGVVRAPPRPRRTRSRSKSPNRRSRSPVKRNRGSPATSRYSNSKEDYPHVSRLGPPSRRTAQSPRKRSRSRSPPKRRVRKYPSSSSRSSSSASRSTRSRSR